MFNGWFRLQLLRYFRSKSDRVFTIESIHGTSITLRHKFGLMVFQKGCHSKRGFPLTTKLDTQSKFHFVGQSCCFQPADGDILFLKLTSFSVIAKWSNMHAFGSNLLIMKFNPSPPLASAIWWWSSYTFYGSGSIIIPVSDNITTR